jgi:hypothetical protein
MTALKKSHAPAVGMVVGHTCALRKAGEAKGRVRGVFAVESEQLTHGISWIEVL